MFSKIEKSPALTLGLIAALFLAFGYAASLAKITDFIIFCIFVLGFDLLYGHMGQLSFGHMLYLGAGAYGTGMFAYHVHPDPFLSILAGVALGLGLELLLGPVVVRGPADLVLGNYPAGLVHSADGGDLLVPVHNGPVLGQHMQRTTIGRDHLVHRIQAQRFELA